MSNLLFTTTAEADARLVGTSKAVSQPGFTLDREWSYIDATVADTLVVTLQGVATYTDPKADGETYTGTFANSEVKSIAANSDPDGGERYVNIRQKVILVTSPANTTALALLDAIITQENEILTPFALKTGEEDTVAYVYKNINTANRATMMAYADADLVTALPGAGWSYVDRKFQEEENGTATFTVLFKRIAWNAFNAASPDLTWDDNDSTTHEERHDLWFKVQKSDYPTLTNLYTATSLYNVMSVRITERDDGALNVERVQLKEAVGTSGAEIEPVDNGKLQPFAIQSGDYAQFTIVNERMKLKTTAYATPASSSGYTLIQTKEEKTGNGLWNKYYTYRKHTWVAWDHDTGAADLTEYDNAGTDDEKEVITKTWFGIVKASLATAIAAIRTGTTNFAPTAGYIITKASVRDNQDGSITLIQEQKKQVNNKDVGVAATPGYQAIRPFGWDGGSFNEIETHYEHFTASGLATAIAGESAPATYTLVAREPTLQADGLYNMVFRYRATTFSNTSGTTPNIVLANLRTLGHTNPIDINGDSTTYGINGSLTKGADGVPIANAPEILNNQAVTSGFLFSRATLEDNGDGSASIRRLEDKIRDKTVPVVVQFSASNGRHEERQIVEWYNLTAADVALLVADAYTNRAAMASATYTPPTGSSTTPTGWTYAAGHKLDTIQDEPESNGQTFKVTRVSFIPRNFGGGGTASFPVGEIATWKVYGDAFKTSGGDDAYGAYVVTVGRKVTTVEADARSWADLSDVHPNPADGHKLGSLEWMDKYDVYVSYKVNIVAGVDFTP